MDKIFFSADHHFGDKNIIRLSKRPFKSVAQMNKIMIEKWNEKITCDDTVFYLGDFARHCSQNKIRSILNQLNGKIHFIRGDHDKFNAKNSKKFEWIKDYYELKLPNPKTTNHQLIVLMHYPILSWKDRFKGACHLHGHSHGSRGKHSKKLCFDIGVDCNNFYPISYDEVLNIIELKNKQNDR